MIELKKTVKRLVDVPGLGRMVVLIHRGGVAMRRPGERDSSAYELPWFNLHWQAARLRARETLREREMKRAARRAARSVR
jgi:hypothetical protein